MRPDLFVQRLLSQEREWTAVDQFSHWHEQAPGAPDRSGHSYRRLLPLELPKAGQQYAFEVDLDKCSGCKACVAACHSLNGLDETETWRKVGLLVGAPAAQQHVTTACHHCVDPGCLNGCPVLAYDKDPSTGIVRHLDDQCIGCQYCIMKCPYEVPQYSNRLGIVRKCDMCYHRLAAGEAPACVQACPTEAIRVCVVDQSSLQVAFRAESSEPINRVQKAPVSLARGSSDAARVKAKGEFLPDSPNPALTIPTTRFFSSNPDLSALKAADHTALRREPPHWPLIVMLLLSQASAGLVLACALFENPARSFSPALNTAFALLVTGLLAAVLHLGRPLKAWRAFLGWRSSWLSRELLALHLFALVLAVGCWPGFSFGRNRFYLGFVALVGLLAVFTSAMVYVDTGRAAWSARITFVNFFGASLLLGSVLATLLLSTHSQRGSLVVFLGFNLATRAGLFLWRRSVRETALGNDQSPIHLSARIVHELLPRTYRVDIFLFIINLAAVPLALIDTVENRVFWVLVSLIAIFLGELISRYFFFVAGAGKRMPGGVEV